MLKLKISDLILASMNLFYFHVDFYETVFVQNLLAGLFASAVFRHPHTSLTE